MKEADLLDTEEYRRKLGDPGFVTRYNAAAAALAAPQPVEKPALVPRVKEQFKLDDGTVLTIESIEKMSTAQYKELLRSRPRAGSSSGCSRGKQGML